MPNLPFRPPPGMRQGGRARIAAPPAPQGRSLAAARDQLRRVPWFAASALIHACLFIALALLASRRLRPAERAASHVFEVYLIGERPKPAEEAKPPEPKEEPRPEPPRPQPKAEPVPPPELIVPPAPPPEEPAPTPPQEVATVKGTPVIQVHGGPAPARDVFAARRPAAREEAVRQWGGTPGSEQAVDAGLRWLHAHQEPDGRWNDGDPQLRLAPGLSGLALMAFLGKGHTHTEQGAYRATVAQALRYLLSLQAADGRIAAQPQEPESFRFTINFGSEEGRATVVEVSDVPAGDVRWLWPGKVPIGKLSLLVGDPGRGKSLLSLDLAARLSLGRVWPDGQANTLPPSSTLLLSAEDDVADTIRPRLEAMGADVRYVRSMRGLFSEGFYKGFQLPRDLPTLEEAVENTPDVRLVVIDPLMAFLSAGAASNNSALRTLLATLQEMSERLGFAVLALTHLTKASGASPLYRAMGSLALTAASRAVWTLWPDQDEPERTFFIPLKCNLSAALHAHAYRIVASPLNPKQPTLIWEPEAIPMALMATSTAHPMPRLRDQECMAWLRGLLGKGPVPSRDVEKAAAEEGYGYHILRRAKRILGVITSPDGLGATWVQRLPD